MGSERISRIGRDGCDTLCSWHNSSGSAKKSSLRWRDVDEADGEIRIRQQVQRIQGELRFYPVKTAAGRRDLPLLPIAQSMLDLRRQTQAANSQELGRAWQDNVLIFTTKTGRPVEPRNLVRSFHRICDASKLRDIKVHHLRHTTATLLKNLGVPARDAQIILGHSRLAVTLEIYTHEDRQAQRQALGRISEALGQGTKPPSADAADPRIGVKSVSTAC
jgi:integrase